MPRITVSGVDRQEAAEAIFQNDEDLIVVEDEDSGFPSGRKVWGPSDDDPIKAKSEGNYSWLATFSPGEKANQAVTRSNGPFQSRSFTSGRSAYRTMQETI